MSTRIRYTKGVDKEWVSVQVFKTTAGRELKAELSPSMKEGAVKDAVTGDYLIVVKGTSAHKTKIKVKKALADYGVEFVTEGRKKRNEQTEGA